MRKELFIVKDGLHGIDSGSRPRLCDIEIQPLCRPMPHPILNLTPADEYSARLRQRSARAAALQRRSRWIGNARIFIFALIVILWWKIAKTSSPPIYWLLAPILAFIALVSIHRRVDAAIK